MITDPPTIFIINLTWDCLLAQRVEESWSHCCSIMWCHHPPPTAETQYHPVSLQWHRARGCLHQNPEIKRFQVIYMHRKSYLKIKCFFKEKTRQYLSVEKTHLFLIRSSKNLFWVIFHYLKNTYKSVTNLQTSVTLKIQHDFNDQYMSFIHSNMQWRLPSFVSSIEIRPCLA